MTYQLPVLPYAYDALEPIMDARTMEIHYSKHHQAYVDNLNKSLAVDQALAGKPVAHFTLEQLFGILPDLPVAIRNNAGGHYNHSLFWTLLTAPLPASTSSANTESQVIPGFAQAANVAEFSDQQPAGAIAAEINAAFGSFDQFKVQFADAATKRFGSGWAWLIWSAAEQKLKITSTANQDNPLMNLPGNEQGEPLLGLDVWEHAYYLQYQNKRPDYIGAFWKIVNWNVVNDRLLKSS